ncbi:MAG TPA: hypothetical protein VFN10_15245 [Thermoanaerobaculia bacterium]|nr:hypothetical protein [Thermoanaerobaculia bacterium]
MLIVSLCQVLFGMTALVFCALAASAVLRRDLRAHLWLTLAGAFALVVFVSIPSIRIEMIAVALLTIAAGVLMTPTPAEEPPLSLDSTATRRRR